MKYLVSARVRLFTRLAKSIARLAKLTRSPMWAYKLLRIFQLLKDGASGSAIAKQEAELTLHLVRVSQGFEKNSDLPNPLLHEHNFERFALKVLKTKEPIYGDALKKILPSAGSRAGQSRERAWHPPENRELRLLIVSHNWNFLADAITGFEAQGCSVRTLDFSIIQQALELHRSKVGETFPSMFVQLHSPSGRKNYCDIIASGLATACPIAANLLEWCDAIFVDWAAAPAVWLSKYSDADKKLVVRCHSYEAFSTWPLLMDYDNVDELVFIADHIKDIHLSHFREVGGVSSRISVVPNIRHLEVEVSQMVFDRSKTLGMMGYGNKNKDPLFAVEVLKALRRQDPAWRLHLAGHPFANTEIEKYSEYKRAFDEKLFALGDAVEISGFQSKPERWFEEVGFVLSTSRREGSHEAVVEGMRQGCIPVVRRWPMVCDFGAPECTFPGIQTFNDAESAAKYIISCDFNETSDYYRINWQKICPTGDANSLLDVILCPTEPRLNGLAT